MLHPVGNLPAHVYWRRRLFFVVLPVIGIALIAWALLSGGGGHTSPSNTATTTTKASHPPESTTPPGTRDSGSVSVGTTAPSTRGPSSPATTPTTTSTTTSTTPSVAAAGKGFCAAADLTVASGVAHRSFAVGSKPVLYMPVTNTGPTACKLDVADKHDEWRVFSGDARVWGSHDCAVEAGSTVITLLSNQTIRLSITWSGYTSAPGCPGPRLVVQAGTYRLYAYLNGKRSSPTTFTVT